MTPRVFCAGAVAVLLLPACATQQVSFSNDVVPILQDRCIKCHAPPDGKGYRETGLSMLTYESLMTGTDYGPVIIAGDSRRSIFNMMVEGRAGKKQRMPHNEAEALSRAQIDTLKEWVNQGALDN